MKPEEVFNSVTEGINTGDLDLLMSLYEPNTCFASQPGRLAKSPIRIRECLRTFIDMRGKLDLRIKRVLQADNLALVTTEWSFSGAGSDVRDVHFAAQSADVLRKQPDGTWQFVIDNPWGTD
jgi:ketosteroid isomerase-like protein